MAQNIPTLVVAAIVALVIGCMMCAFQVRFTETAVVTRFDKIRQVIEPNQAGLHFKLPWPIDRVHLYDTRLRSFETEFRQAATRDQKTIILTAYATWRVADGARFLAAVGREDVAADRIRDLLEHQVQLVLRSHDLDELVNIDEDMMKLDEIEQIILHGKADSASGQDGESATAGIREPARKDYGIEIVSVGIKRFGLPASVTKDVFTRMKEDRQKAIKQLQAEGQAEATKIRVSAEEIAQKITTRAQAYAKTLEGRGEAEAAKYYKVFAENQRLSSFLKKLETMERILASGQITLVFDANVLPFDTLNPKRLLQPETAGTVTPPGAGAESDGDVAAMTRRPTAENDAE